jgi:hypothetical protein
VSVLTVGKVDTLVRHPGDVRHRAEAVEYRVEQKRRGARGAGLAALSAPSQAPPRDRPYGARKCSGSLRLCSSR